MLSNLNDSPLKKDEVWVFCTDVAGMVSKLTVIIAFTLAFVKRELLEGHGVFFVFLTKIVYIIMPSQRPAAVPLLVLKMFSSSQAITFFDVKLPQPFTKSDKETAFNISNLTSWHKKLRINSILLCDVPPKAHPTTNISL